MKGLKNLRIVDAPDGCTLAVKVVPGASRNRVAGVLGDALKIAVAVAPEKGKANAAVAGMLAEILIVPASAVQLVSGHTSPRKEFRIIGLSCEQARNRLAESQS